MEGYFGPDELTSYNTWKLVKTRTDHECMGIDKDDDHDILAGQMAMRETAIQVDCGRVSCYVCLPCAGRWLDELEGGAG